MSNAKTITLTQLQFDNKSHIGIGFVFSESTKTIVKAIPEVRWSAIHRTYYIPYYRTTLNALFNYFKECGYYVDYKALKKTPKAFEVPKKIKPVLSMAAMFASMPAVYKNLLRNYTGYLKGKRLSESTVKSYGYFILRFLNYHQPKEINSINQKDIDLFFEVVIAGEKFSISSHRQCVSALKYLLTYCQIPDLNADDLKRPRKSRKLPVVLSKEEIIDLIQVTKNLKHRAIIGLIYSCGLRIGELLNLKIDELDFDRNQLRVNLGKGRKDRTVVMSASLKPLMLNYLNTYRPKIFIIEGRDGGPYSATSIRQFLKKSCQLARITKKVTPHALRHSYATHLLENGVDLRHIQLLLGHAKPETTMIYTHVAHKDLMQIHSPLDTTIESLTRSQNNTSEVLLSRNIKL